MKRDLILTMDALDQVRALGRTNISQLVAIYELARLAMRDLF